MKYCLLFLLIVILTFSCKSEKRNIKIQLTANGNKYNILTDQSSSSKITYDTVSYEYSYKAITNKINRKELKFSFFGGYNQNSKDIDPTIIVFNSIINEDLQKEITIIYELSNELHNATGIECFIKTTEKESCKFILDKEATNTFKINIKIDRDYASGSFSGVLTSNTDSSKVFITDGYFENIPFLNLAKN